MLIFHEYGPLQYDPRQLLHQKRPQATGLPTRQPRIVEDHILCNIGTAVDCPPRRPRKARRRTQGGTKASQCHTRYQEYRANSHRYASVWGRYCCTLMNLARELCCQYKCPPEIPNFIVGYQVPGVQVAWTSSKLVSLERCRSPPTI